MKTNRCQSAEIEVVAMPWVARMSLVLLLLLEIGTGMLKRNREKENRKGLNREGWGGGEG